MYVSSVDFGSESFLFGTQTPDAAYTDLEDKATGAFGTRPMRFTHTHNGKTYSVTDDESLQVALALAASAGTILALDTVMPTGTPTKVPTPGPIVPTELPTRPPTSTTRYTC